jgi:hypothetical protein
MAPAADRIAIPHEASGRFSSRAFVNSYVVSPDLLSGWSIIKTLPSHRQVGSAGEIITTLRDGLPTFRAQPRIVAVESDC